MDAVKIEGGADFAPTVRALTRAGIPVMGHIGFTPQTTPTAAGYKVQGRTAAAALALVEDAESSGEGGRVQHRARDDRVRDGEGDNRLARRPDDRDRSRSGLRRPDTRPPRHTRALRQVHPQVREEIPRTSLPRYRSDRVLREGRESGTFPDEEHTFHMEEKEAQRLLRSQEEVKHPRGNSHSARRSVFPALLLSPSSSAELGCIPRRAAS